MVTSLANQSKSRPVDLAAHPHGNLQGRVQRGAKGA